MTFTAGAAQHPDDSEISDLGEGLLLPTREAALRDHLDSCEQCGDLHASLEEIRSLLGSLPLRDPMPDDVAERIDAALAAEASAAAETRTAGPYVSRETSEQPGESTSAARPAGHPRGATGPGRRPSSRRRRTVILGTAFGAAAVGMSIFLLQSLQQSDSAGSAADQGVGAAQKSQGDLSKASLEGRVQALLSKASPSEAPGYDPDRPSFDTKSSPENTSPRSTSPRSPLRAPTVNVPSCVQEGTGRDAPALALTKGNYGGTAAFLVVLPHVSDSTLVQAYVVDASCVGSSPTTKGRLLLTHSYARP